MKLNFNRRSFVFLKQYQSSPKYQLDLEIAKNGIFSNSPRMKPHEQQLQKYCFTFGKSTIFLRSFLKFEFKISN